MERRGRERERTIKKEERDEAIHLFHTCALHFINIKSGELRYCIYCDFGRPNEYAYSAIFNDRYLVN